MQNKSLLNIAIVGKPNVGKSTLFNLLCKRNLAIVGDIPGTTLDRKRYMANISDLNFWLIDTAGWQTTTDNTELHSTAIAQTRKALEEADSILFMLDGKAEIDVEDLELAQILRTSGKTVALIVNKSESRIITDANDIFKFGLGEPVYISAAHNLGMHDLYEEITKMMPVADGTCITSKQKSALSLAIVGRPNVGKSTLFNKILKQERAIVYEYPGTTRDAITETFSHTTNETCLLTDTAGIRKRRKEKNLVEFNALGQAISAIKNANVVALVTDITQALEKQDLAIAKICLNEGKGLILVVNKIDLTNDLKASQKAVEEYLQHCINGVTQLAVLYTCASKGQNIRTVVHTAHKIVERWKTKISTNKLNNFLQTIKPITIGHKASLRIKYITQVAIQPPTFNAYVNRAAKVPSSYVQYVKKALAKHFKLFSIPLRIRFLKTANPYITNSTRIAHRHIKP